MNIAYRCSTSSQDRGKKNVKIVKRYALGALLAMALACSANAKDKDKPKDDDPPTYSIPDGGSTAALLGLSIVLAVLAQRKFAIVK